MHALQALVHWLNAVHARALQVLPASDSYATQIDAGAVQAVCEDGGELTEGTECQTNVGDSCPPGRRPVYLNSGNDGKACALCRAGAGCCAPACLPFLLVAFCLQGWQGR